jgi:hypothetical protein
MNSERLGEGVFLRPASGVSNGAVIAGNRNKHGGAERQRSGAVFNRCSASEKGGRR